MTNELTFSQLEAYIRENMRMSHIYQPVMLRALLAGDGTATLEDIAKALLSYDRSQVEYYEIRTKNMVGKVLTQNGLVEPIREGRRITGYRLNIGSLNEAELTVLKQRCDERLEAYLEKFGKGIWVHRGVADGYLPGSIRYEVLKRAKYRCELCGAHEVQAAMHIDHIVPRSRGGLDDISNLQVLCITCNTNKRDKDDTDFRGVLESYQDRSQGCIFCEIEPSRVIVEDELCFAIRDGFAVTPLHTLIIPKRHVADYFDLYQPELNSMHRMLKLQRADILKQDKDVTGFNVGINAGRDAGQTIFHVHMHLIPRRNGDVVNPRGGVRGVIPERQKY